MLADCVNWLAVRFCTRLEDRIGALEAKDVLTDEHKQSVMRITCCKMLETVCIVFKAYHYEIVDGLETNVVAAREQVVFDEHQKKAVARVLAAGTLTSV